MLVLDVQDLLPVDAGRERLLLRASSSPEETFMPAPSLRAGPARPPPGSPATASACTTAFDIRSVRYCSYACASTPLITRSSTPASAEPLGGEPARGWPRRPRCGPGPGRGTCRSDPTGPASCSKRRASPRITPSTEIRCRTVVSFRHFSRHRATAASRSISPPAPPPAAAGSSSDVAARSTG